MNRHVNQVRSKTDKRIAGGASYYMKSLQMGMQRHTCVYKKSWKIHFKNDLTLEIHALTVCLKNDVHKIRFKL